jgi:hypothetical protein
MCGKSGMAQGKRQEKLDQGQYGMRSLEMLDIREVVSAETGIRN